MTDREQRLRAALTQETESVRVTPELRRRIAARLRPAAAFRARALAVSVAAVVVVIGVVAWLVAGSGIVRKEVVGPPPKDAFFAGYWPVTSRAEAETIQRDVDGGSDTWRRDPVQVAQAYGRSLGWDLAQGTDDVSQPVDLPQGYAEVTIEPKVGEGDNKIAGPSHQVRLVALEGVDRPAWFVAGIESATIEANAPASGDQIASPVRVSGSGHTFEGNIVVSVLEDVRSTQGSVDSTRGHRELGQAPVTAGGAEVAPFEGSIDFDRPSSGSGIVRFEGGSGIEGPSTDVTVVRVRFAKAPSASSEPTPFDNEVDAPPEADDAFKCIVSARHNRDMDMARPCMSERYVSTITDPVQFIGPSSPSVDRATIVSSSRQGDRIVYDTLVFSGGAQGLQFISEDTIAVVRENDRWLADGWEPGEERPIGETSRVTLSFLTLGDTPKCEGDTPTADSFVPVERDVPSEVVIDDLALSVTRELLTGPWSDEGDAAGSFAGGSRVHSVRVSGGIATVEVNDAALPHPGWECDHALAALRRTLTRLPGIEDVVLQTRAPQEVPSEPDV